MDHGSSGMFPTPGKRIRDHTFEAIFTKIKNYGQGYGSCPLPRPLSIADDQDLLRSFQCKKTSRPIPIPSNRVISSLEGKFGTVCETFLSVLERLFMEISDLCKKHF